MTVRCALVLIQVGVTFAGFIKTIKIFTVGIFEVIFYRWQALLTLVLYNNYVNRALDEK